MKPNPSQVLSAYNAWRTENGAHIVYGHHVQVRNALKRLIVWCDENKIDPLEYVNGLRDALSDVPELNWLRSEQYLRIWEDKSFDRAMQAVGVKPKTLELWPAQEKLKLLYVGREWLCMVRFRFTGGFNPMSKLCLGCPLQERCRAIRI